MTSDSLGELHGLGLENLVVLLFLGNQHSEGHLLRVTFTWKWTNDLWLLPNGTSEHLVSPVEGLLSSADWGDVDLLGDLDDLLESDELLVNAGDLFLGLSDLDVDLVDSLGDDLLSLDKEVDLAQWLLDELSAFSDLLWISWDNENSVI